MARRLYTWGERSVAGGKVGMGDKAVVTPDGKLSFDSQAVVVTGSSRGIGLALARALAGRGARVVLNGRDPAALEQARLALAGQGGTVLAVAADVSTPEGARHLIAEAVREFGRIDALVANAGIGGPPSMPVWEVDPAAWSAVLAANLTGPFLCCAEAVKAMRAMGRGRIVTVLSAAATHPFAGAAAYAAAKAGLAMLTRCLALELDGSGVAVVGIEPASHATAMTAACLPAETVAALDPPEAALPPFLWALSAPAALVHGRILSASRFAADAEAERRLAAPLAAARPFVPYMPRLADPNPGARHLDFLENPAGPPRRAVAALRATAPALDRYPDPTLSALRGALGERLGLASPCFTFGTGSAEVVERLLRTFVPPGHTVVATEPTWPVLHRFCAMLGLRLRTVPYRLARGPDGLGVTLDLGELADAVDAGTRLVYLPNPNFPLAAWTEPAGLRRLLARLDGAVPLVVDEAYVDYADAARQGITPALVREGHWLVGVRTFSKFHGLAGLRLGFAYGPPTLIGLAARLEATFAVPRPAEAAALAALADVRHAERTRTTNRRGLAQLRRGLAGLGLGALPSDVNFLMAECPGSLEAVFDGLHARGLYTPGVAWENLVMLPVAAAADNRSVLDELARQR